MNAAQIHLILTHVPVIALPAGLLFLAWAMHRHDDPAQRFALLFLTVTAAVAVPVFLSGKGAEEGVEHLMGVVERAMHPHEEAAELSLWLVLGTGAAALAGLLRRRSVWALRATLALGLIAASSLAWTAHLGGAIRHPEAGAGSILPGEGGEGSEEGDDD